METPEDLEAAALLAELDNSFAELKSTYAGLSDADMTVVMQGRWSVKDILAHIAGWHREMVPAFERLARGEKAIPAGVDYTDPDPWNARFVEARRAMGPEQVKAELEDSFVAFRQALLSVPEPRRRGSRTAGRITHEAGIDHHRHHAAQIRAWHGRR
jgi:uncharacterized damage-inducible protein DinB